MKTMKTAKLVKVLPPAENGMVVKQTVYKLSTPLDGYDYVVSSAANVWDSGPETYLFGCDKDGNIEDWGELHGSFRGRLDCEEAIKKAGYIIE